MQDRFKFRYYDINNMMQYFSLTNCYYTNFDYSRLMQYTGLKDKNGKLIYEGDRVYIDCEGETAIIKWSDDLARFTIHFEDKAVFADFDNYHSKELEVIGNIYENSELPKE